jgi:hypothetical protein
MTLLALSFLLKKLKPSDEVVDDEAESNLSTFAPDEKKKAQRTTPLISYELFMWTWFITLTVLAIADRFTWNVWPRQTYSIGAGS